MRRSVTAVLVASSLPLLLSCGGGDGGGTPTPPDESGQTVTIQVTTTGVDLDADGYTVRLGSRSASVPASGTVTFEGVAAGTYELRLEGVANNCLVDGSAVATLTVGGSGSAQASFAVLCTVDFGDGLPTVACEEFTVEASSAVPMDRLLAGSVPAGLHAPLGARVQTPDGSLEGYAWFEEAEDGSVEFITPLHPSGDLAGGEVLIRATDGTTACAPWRFTIEPLPAAPGEASAALDQLQEILRRQAAVLESTPDALRTTPIDRIPDPLLPLAILQWVLDHPDNENSLRAVVDGDAPTPYPVDRLDAVLARAGFRDALATATAAPVGIATTLPASPLATVDPLECTPAGVGTDTQLLNDCMNANRQITGELADLLVATGPSLSLALGVWAATGATTPAQNVLANMGWAVTGMKLFAASTLPSRLVGETASLIPPRFPEDAPYDGSWEASVGAVSEGWEITAIRFGATLAEQVRNGLSAVGVDVNSAVASDVLSQLSILLDPYLPDYDIPPENFGPVRIDDPLWSQVRYQPDPGASLRKLTHTTHRPVIAGETHLEIRDRNNLGGPETFGGSSFLIEETVVVDSVQIEIIPSDTIVDPQKQAVFIVMVENAHFEDSLRIATKQASSAGFAAASGPNGGFVLVYTPPPNASFTDPDSLHIEHTARTGARASGPRRFDFARIRFGTVVITPQPACLDLSEQVTLSAEVLGIDNQDVTWSADAGTIDAQGNYTAPSNRPAGGSVTITAASVEEPEIEGEITVTIGCSCAFGFTLGGQSFTPQSGDRMVFNSSQGRLTGLTLTRASENWSLRMLPPTTDPNDRPNAAGSWAMAVQGDFGLTSPADAIYATESDQLAVANLLTYVPNQQLRGSVSGTAELVSTATPGPIDFSWWFAIRYAPGEFTCTVQ